MGPLYIIATKFRRASIEHLSANAHQLSADNAINSAQDFYRVQRPCSSIQRKYFGQLPVEVPFKVSLKAHLKVRDGSKVNLKCCFT